MTGQPLVRPEGRERPAKCWTGEAEIDGGRIWKRISVIASDLIAARDAIADAALALGATVVVVHNVARALATYSDGEVAS